MSDPKESSDQEQNLGDKVNPTNSGNRVAKIVYDEITWIDADLEYVPKPLSIPDYETFISATMLYLHWLRKASNIQNSKTVLISLSRVTR